MTDPIRPHIICLGAFGDLCIVLPFCHEHFTSTGQKPAIAVAQNYASLLDGVSYVERLVFPEDWKRGADLALNERGVEFARKSWPGQPVRLVNPMADIETKLESRGRNFVAKIWETLGSPTGWGWLPLIFDQRDPQRERKLVDEYLENGEPVILLALSGVASPLPSAAELEHNIRAAFPGCKVIDLCKVVAEKPYDLLALMDRAKALVSADTMHLHLSRASTVPTVALSCDKPDAWRGTPWNKRFLLHCRYSELPRRQSEILYAVEDSVAGRHPATGYPIFGLRRNGYNPSVVKWGGGTFLSYRFHTSDDWRTQLGVAWLEGAEAKHEMLLEFPGGFERFGMEDMRLFVHNDRLFGCYVVSTIVDSRPWPVFKSMIGYAEIDLNGSFPIARNPIQPVYGRNDLTAIQKNWVPFSHAGAIWFIYQCDPEHIVIGVEGEKVVAEHKTLAPRWAWGGIRGGTVPVPWHGRWLRFFHSQEKIGSKPRDVRYHVGALVMDPRPPFEVQAVSQRPIISGHEWFNSSAPHWKANVAIPYGAIETHGGWLLSVGINDSAACLYNLSEDQLNLE